MRPLDSSSLLRRGLLLVAAAAILLHCWQFRDFAVDDAGISFAYARNFAAGKGLVNVAGAERVEGYSNFLWVALLAAFVRLGLDVFMAAKLLGAALAVAVIFGMAELTAALRGRRTPLDGAVALLGASLTPIPYWSMSGLEGPLYMALIVWCAVRLIREREEPHRRPLSALLAAGIALTRPDGWLVAGVAAGLQLFGGRGLARFARWLALALLPVGLHLAWRYHYYAYPFPNTFYVKLPKPFQLRELFDLDSQGWSYVRTVFHRYRIEPTLPLAALALVRRDRFWPRAIVLGLLLSVLAFPLYARGDWMNEGRFVVALLPLLCVLLVDGCERVGALFSRLPLARVGVELVLVAALGLQLVPNAIRLTLVRRGHYPVPVEVVAVRSRMFFQLAQRFRVARPWLLDADLGGTSLYANMPIVDLGALCDVTFAHQPQRPSLLREYVWGERRPTFARFQDNWRAFHLDDYPEFEADYVPLHLVGQRPDGYWLSREAFTIVGIDTRTPLRSEIAEHLDLLGAQVTPDEVELRLLVKQDGPREGLRLLTDREKVAVVVADGQAGSVLWRAGEVLRARMARPRGSDLKVCGPRVCHPLAGGETGARPAVLPDATQRDRLLKRGELLAAAAIDARRGDRSLAEPLEQRGRARAEAGDIDGALDDLRMALSLDPDRAFVRRLIEELRRKEQVPYRGRSQVRLLEALRAFQLHPDGAALGVLALFAKEARRPEWAVRAHLATELLPDDDRGRLDLADCYLATGLPERALALLPDAPTSNAHALEAARVAFAAGDDARTRALGGRVTAAPFPLEDGLVLRDVWARLLDTGRVEISFALEKSGAHPSRIFALAGENSLFERPPENWSAGEIYVHRVQRALLPGRSTIAHGIEVDLNPFSADFENGRLDGWTRVGDGFSSAPRRAGRQDRWYGYDGDFFVDSLAHGDLGTGTLRSSPLATDVDEVCFMVAGGSSPSVGVALEVDGRTVVHESGRDDDILRDHCFDLRPFANLERRVAIYDQAKGPNGYVAADDFACFHAGRAVPCAGSAQVAISPASAAK